MLNVLLMAAIFTSINPAPQGEADLLPFVAANFSGYDRVSDDADIFWDTADGSFIVAFEDLPLGPGDFDYNDLVMRLEFDTGALITSTFIFSDSAATPLFGFDGLYLFDDASCACGTIKAYSNPALNIDQLDHMVTWKQRPNEVPEPGTLGLLLLGVAAIGLRLRRS